MEQVGEILLNVFKLIVALIVLGLGTERGTELVKAFFGWIGEKVTWLDLASKRAFILAAAVAFFIVYFFGIDLSILLPMFGGYDPELAKMVTALLTMLFSNVLHDKLLKPSA